MFYFFFLFFIFFFFSHFFRWFWNHPYSLVPLTSRFGYFFGYMCQKILLHVQSYRNYLIHSLLFLFIY